MQRIGVRELRQHASRYLDQVKAGQTVEVTERGVLVALLVPPTPARATRERLVMTGELLPASGALRLPSRVRATRTSEAVLDELRTES